MTRRIWCSAQVGLLLVLLAGGTSAQAPAPAPAPAPEEGPGWHLKSKAGISLSQSSFSKSWAGDEVGTVSWIATSDSEAKKKLVSWATWNNTLLLQFGQTHQQDRSRDHWLPPAKSADKITYRGIVRFDYGGYVDPFIALDLDSQFFSRSESAQTTRLFTPTEITESAGIARQLLHRGDQWQLVTRIGFALREKIDRLGYDVATSSPSTQTTTDGGLEWLSRCRLAAPKDRTVYKSELRVFKAVSTSEADAVKRLYWPAVDVDWQNSLSNRVMRFVSFDLFWELRYDKQVDLRGQFKQTMGLGLTWQFI